MTWLTTVCKKQTREQTLNTNKAKNVVFFVGDGMGITTGTAARILTGQLEGDHREETDLECDKFPSVALSKVTLIITSRTYTLKQLL
jgi:alkaline phosphatase